MADTHLGWMDTADDSSVTPSTDPRVGLVLSDRYRIDRKIGQGGMGSVFEGTHLLIERRVAIKCLHPQYADDADAVRRFHNEARAVSAIGHPHIVEAIDMGRMDDGSLYLVFEYLEGVDLADRIERAPLSVQESVDIAIAVCDALEAAHAKGIVHRDLKPENIFLTERAANPHFVKILDFGISKLGIDAISAMTAKGAVMGTPHYMSPEQASGKGVDERTDLYALGVVLYSMLTGGRLPFDADSLPALMMKICTERPPPLSRTSSDAPPALAAVVDRLLQKRRDERFASAAEAREALKNALDAPQLPESTDQGDADQDPDLRLVETSLLRWVLPAALVFSVVVGGLIYARSDDPPEPTVVETDPVATVTIQLAAQPAGARATLDGQAITLPYVLRTEASDEDARELVVEHEGYESQHRTISLRESGEVEVLLHRLPSGTIPAEPSDTSALASPTRMRTPRVSMQAVRDDTESPSESMQEASDPEPVSETTNEPTNEAMDPERRGLKRIPI